jgi:uncharacterized protein (DUF983 family)
VNPSSTTLVLRGLRKRCPRCGHKDIFVSWTHLKARCPNCSHAYEREEGYWVGAIIMNTAVTETLFLVLFLAVLFATIPDIAWIPLLVIGIVTNGLFPVWFFPRSKTTWVAVDLILHPV